MVADPARSESTKPERPQVDRKARMQLAPHRP